MLSNLQNYHIIVVIHVTLIFEKFSHLSLLGLYDVTLTFLNPITHTLKKKITQCKQISQLYQVCLKLNISRNSWAAKGHTKRRKRKRDGGKERDRTHRDGESKREGVGEKTERKRHRPTDQPTLQTKTQKRCTNTARNLSAASHTLQQTRQSMPKVQREQRLVIFTRGTQNKEVHKQLRTCQLQDTHYNKQDKACLKSRENKGW